MQTVFITSASGRIGSRLIPLLLSTQNLKLILPTTNAARLTSSLPKSDLITVVKGSIQDPQWVESQLRTHSVSAAFLCLTGIDELFTTLNMFSAIQRTPSVKHIVYLSACMDFVVGAGTLNGWKAAHGVVKSTIEFALRDLSAETGITSTVLGPSLFYGNDARQKAGLMKGVYTEPLGKKGASRVSEDDIAEAVKIALLDGSEMWNGKKVMLGSRKWYTESDIDALWSEALGKPVKSADSDDAGLDRLEEHFRSALDPAWSRDLRLMYEGIRKEGFGPNDQQYAEQVAFLRREPRSYENFVSKLGKDWKA